MDWQLEPGKRYRLWYRDKTPMPDTVVFERVAQKAATTADTTTLTRVRRCLSKRSGYVFDMRKVVREMVLGLDDLTGCGLELLD